MNKWVFVCRSPCVVYCYIFPSGPAAVSNPLHVKLHPHLKWQTASTQHRHRNHTLVRVCASVFALGQFKHTHTCQHAEGAADGVLTQRWSCSTRVPMNSVWSVIWKRHLDPLLHSEEDGAPNNPERNDRSRNIQPYIHYKLASWLGIIKSDYTVCLSQILSNLPNLPFPLIFKLPCQ